MLKKYYLNGCIQCKSYCCTKDIHKLWSRGQKKAVYIGAILFLKLKSTLVTIITLDRLATMSLEIQEEDGGDE